jgi:hypothetical protein
MINDWQINNYWLALQMSYPPHSAELGALALEPQWNPLERMMGNLSASARRLDTACEIIA